MICWSHREIDRNPPNYLDIDAGAVREKYGISKDVSLVALGDEAPLLKDELE